MKKLLLLFMMLAMAIPLWASEHTVTINRNEGLYQTGTGVYYCVKDGIMMTFTSGLDNENYLVEHQQVYFEVNSYNYIIKRIVFHCVDSTTTANLMDCFYWGPTTLSIVQNFYNQSDPGTLTVTDPYTAVWQGSSNHMQFTTMAKPVRFGSVEIIYDKLDGDIFDLVTDISQIVQGKTYILVTQNYNKVMKIKKTDDATFPATDIVGWMGPDGNEKSRVKVDGNAQLFRMEEVVDTTIDGYSRKSAWLNTLNGFIRPSSTSGSNDLILSTGVTDWNRSYSYIGTAYNFLVRFKSKGSGYYVRYDSSNNGKFRMYNSTNDENTRVWLYKLAEAYNVNTECDPASGGTITLGDGVVEGTSQSGETVHFTVDPADGYSLTSVEVKMDNTSFTQPVTDNGDGSYSFVMPGMNVTVTAHFEIAGAYQIFTENTPAGGGVVNVGGQVTTVDNNNYANGGANVTVTPSPNWGWEATGITVTDANNNQVTVTDNGNGSYSFTMPEVNVTVNAGYKRVVGDIFDLVTSGTQIQEGQTYIIVSQNYDKVMRYWTPGQTTFTSTPIVNWPLGSDNKTKVRIDDNAVFFRMDKLNADTTSTGGLNLTRAAYLNTLNGYMRTGNYNVFLSSPLAQVNRGSMMVSGNAYNYLLRFLYDNTSGPNTNYVVRYNNADGNFNVLNWTNQTDNANVLTRVWLYKLAQSYNISTVCTPPEGGSITITGGMDESNMAQAGETVTLDVGTNWGWSISEVVVTNNTTGETITVNTVATSDAGNSYTFVMPDADVTITANFYESVTGLYLLGTAMGRTSWVPAGPRFNYDVNNEQYYLDVYFKGGNSNNEVDQAYGYFSLAKDIDHSITWQTARPDQGSWNAIKDVRLAAEYNYFAVQDGSTDVVLYGDRNDNSFKIPAGVYRIIVNKDMNRMSIVETHLSLTFDPVSGTEVNPGQVVTISSDLEATVHGIAQQYSINEDAQAFKNSTDNWVNQENGNTVVLNQLPPATVTVQAKANIGYIVVPGTAVYNMVPKVYTIEAICNPEVAGTITVASTAHQGDLITFTVGTEPDYVLSSVLIYNNSDPTAQPITPTDNGDGTYSFTMPADDVVIMANFDLKTYDITTVCDPVQGGTITLKGTAADGNEVPNQTVTMTVDANLGFKVTDVTVQQDGTTTPVDVTDNGDGTYSFTMPEGDVTVTAHYELEGVIFKIVTDPSEIVGGEYYTMITREGDRVLNNIAPGAATNFYSSTDIVGWVTPGEYDYVKLDGRACFFSPEDVTDSSISSSLYRTGYLKTSGGYIGIEPNVENNGYAHLALYDSKDNVKPFSMSIDTFWSSSTDHYAYIYYDYENSHSNRDAWQAFFDDLEDNPYFEYNSFLLENTTLSHYDTWLYKPAKMYNITTVVNPDGTESSLELDGGAVGNMGAEGSTIVVWPVAGEGYALSSLVVTIDGTGEVVEATPNIDGSYSFIMPSNDVTITATFTTGYHINWVCDPEDTGEIIVTSTAYAGQHVAFEVLPYDDYEVSGITITIDGDDDEIPYEENEDGTYSFYMPDDHVTIKATLVLHSEVATLQYIEQYDTYYSDTRVTVSDELIGAWRAKQYLWVKDQAPQCSNVYLEKESEETFDFLRECIRRDVSLNGDQSKLIMWQPREWDQSNWAMLDFSKLFPKDAEPDEFGEYQSWSQVRYNEMRDAMQQFVDNKIAAGSITGTYYCKGEPDDSYGGNLYSYPKVQHVIVLDKLPEVIVPVTTAETSLGYPGYVEDPIEVKNYPADPSKYMYNHYMSYNFNTQNLGHTLLPEDVLIYWYEQTGEDPETDYFFMNPKDQEVAQVCGVYLGKIGDEVTDVGFDEDGIQHEETITLSAGEMDFTSGDLFGSYKFDPENGINHYGWTGTFLVPNEGDINDWSDWSYDNGWSCNGWQFNRLKCPVDMEYNLEESYGRPGVGELVPGEGYIFHAVIQYTPTEPGEPVSAPRRENQRQGTPNYWVGPKFYMVYPLDMMSRDDNFTHVKEVKSQDATLIKSITYYNLMGQESKTPFEGINIEVIRYQDGSMISRKILR